jgi:hypothetical protein
MTFTQSQQLIKKQEDTAYEMEQYTSNAHNQFQNYEEIEPNKNMREATEFLLELNAKRNEYVGNMNAFSKMIDEIPKEMEEDAISALRTCNESIVVLDEMRKSLKQRLEYIQEIYKKIVGTWYCDDLINMTFIYRTDFSYDYINHESGFEKKSYFSLQYNAESPSNYEIQRAGSTAYWFDFKNDNELMLYLGDGNNAMWHTFTRQ